MQRLYEPHAYDTARWPDSHWRASCPPLPGCAPAEGALSVDAAIIGAGYAGLNAALELVERHGMRVTVLEAGQPGWGASGRNGGFACEGGTKLSDAAIARRVGASGLREFHSFQRAGIERVADNLERYSIDAEAGQHGEVMFAHSAAAWRRMRRAGPEGGDLLERDALGEAGLGPAGFWGARITRHGFPLHPMRYVLGLARAAQMAGVKICGDSPVRAIQPDGDGWRLITPQAVVRAPRVLVATNGYSSDDIPGWIGGRTLPALSSILVTRSLTAQELTAQGWNSQMMGFDSRHLLHYFRLLPCGRFLFGMRGGISADPNALARIQNTARRHFDTLFPVWSGVETERSWSGLVCLTASLAPYCGETPRAPGLYAAFGWHGNGVAPASEAGRLAGRAMAGAHAPIPELMRTPPRRFPLPRLRRLWLRAAYAGLHLRDGPVRPYPTTSA